MRLVRCSRPDAVVGAGDRRPRRGVDRCSRPGGGPMFPPRGWTDAHPARCTGRRPGRAYTHGVPGTVIVGAQWGDEGKGKITDLLAERADAVVRFQGGN